MSKRDEIIKGEKSLATNIVTGGILFDDGSIKSFDEIEKSKKQFHNKHIPKPLQKSVLVYLSRD